MGTDGVGPGRRSLTLKCDERLFKSIASAIVPEAAQLSEQEWAEFYAVLATALSQRPDSLTRQLSTFISLINVLALVRYARPFRGLSSENRYAVLHALENSRVSLLRKGMWGLRTFVMMGFYARPAAGTALGYQADRRGWGRNAFRGFVQ